MDICNYSNFIIASLLKSHRDLDKKTELLFQVNKQISNVGLITDP